MHQKVLFFLPGAPWHFYYTVSSSVERPLTAASIFCVLPAGGTRSPPEAPLLPAARLNHITGTLCHNSGALICDDERRVGQQCREMPAGADGGCSINIRPLWQVSLLPLRGPTNNVPTDLAPVKRVDAAGRAVVHQSWFGSVREGGEEQRVIIL